MSEELKNTLDEIMKKRNENDMRLIELVESLERQMNLLLASFEQLQAKNNSPIVVSFPPKPEKPFNHGKYPLTEVL